MSQKMSDIYLESNDSTLVENDWECNLVEHLGRLCSHPSLRHFEEVRDQLTRFAMNAPSKKLLETQVLAILNSFQIEGLLPVLSIRQFYWLCEGLLELLEFESLSARIYSSILTILENNLKRSNSFFHMAEHILKKCVWRLKDVTLEEHESLDLLSSLTKILLLTESTRKQLNFILARFVINIQRQSPASLVPLNLPRLVAAWIGNPTFTDSLVLIIFDSLESQNSYIAAYDIQTLANQVSHMMIESLWDTTSSENILIMLRSTSKKLAFDSSTGPYCFFVEFMRALLELSWEVKSERYTEFLLRTVGSVFEAAPLLNLDFDESLVNDRPNNLRTQAHLALVQLAKLLYQLMNCEELAAHYRPALFDATSQITAKLPSAISYSWFNHICKANLLECLALLPIAKQFAKLHMNNEPLNSLYIRVIVDRTPNCERAKLRHLELLKKEALSLSSVNSPHVKCLFLSLLNSKGWKRSTLLAMCAEVLNTDNGAENFMKALQNCANTSEAKYLSSSLTIVVKYSSKQAQDESCKIRGYRVRLIVDKLMSQKEFVIASNIITNGEADYFPKKWFTRCLRWGFDLRLNLEDRTACLLMVENMVLSFGSQSLEFFNLSSMLEFLLLQLKTCHIAHIGIVFVILRALSKKMLNRERIVSVMQTLLRRTIIILHGAQVGDLAKHTIDRLLLIAKGVLQWPLNEIDWEHLVDVLFKIVRNADNESTKRIAFSLLINLQIKWDDLISEAELHTLFKEILEIKSTGLIGTIFSEGMPYLVGLQNCENKIVVTERNYSISSSNLTEYSGRKELRDLLLGNVSKLLGYAHRSESITALDALCLVVREGVVIVTECIPVFVALCFSHSRQVSRKSREALTDLIKCWPNECSLKFSEGLGLVKQPESALNIHFPIIWEQLTHGKSSKYNKYLLISLASLFEPQNSDLGLLSFLTRCLQMLILRSSDAISLLERIRTCIMRYEDETDPRKLACVELSNWLNSRYCSDGLSGAFQNESVECNSLTTYAAI